MKVNEGERAHSVQSLGYRMDDRGGGVQFPVGTRDSSLLQSIQASSDAHLVPYPRVLEPLSLGVMQPGIETDHSPQSCAEVKTTGGR